MGSGDSQEGLGGRPQTGRGGPEERRTGAFNATQLPHPCLPQRISSIWPSLQRAFLYMAWSVATSSPRLTACSQER